MTWQRPAETGILDFVNARTKSSSRLFSRARLALLAGSLTLIASACADDKPLNTFEPAGPKAQEIDSLITWILWVAAIVGFVVVFAGIGISIKNRVKPEDYDPLDFPEQIHGNSKLEWGWTAAPLLILIPISFLTLQSIWSLEEKNEDSELDVLVIGQQWWWEYRYDIDNDGFFEDINEDGVVDEKDEEWPLHLSLDDDDLSIANEMVIPAGVQVDLTITSRDVIHSYWIPRLNGKRDAVPGRLHTWSIEADEPGEYTGWCTEFCGLSHSRMRMSVVALPDAEYNTWLANQKRGADTPSTPDALAGQELFAAQCASCHVVWEAGDDPEQFDPADSKIYTGQFNDGNEERAGRDFEANQVAKAAPNLTHFATRTIMASGTFSTFVGLDANDDDLMAGDGDGVSWADYLGLPGLVDDTDQGPDDIRWNRAQLKRWIKNAPEQKDMAPDEQRGMPAFPALTDEQLDQIIAYLSTLD